MAKRVQKRSYKKHRRKKKHPLRKLLLICLLLMGALTVWTVLILYDLSIETIKREPVSQTSGEYRPSVGEPPYRVAIDAGHGGSDPGARGVIEEKEMTAATARELWYWLEQDPNYIPLKTRETAEDTATPIQRAEAASAQEPQLFLSIHGNSAPDGAQASGFECYPTVPGRTWHTESLYFARLLANGMQTLGASLRGYGGVRYLYYLENDQKQLVEITHAEVRAERSFTVLEDIDCPSVLVEQCFVTNVEDVERFGSEQGCKEVARVYYEAICSYFGTEPLEVLALTKSTFE